MTALTSLAGNRVRAGYVVAGLVVAWLAGADARAWAGALFDENLIVNGDAEQGPAAAAGQRVSVTGWTHTAGATVQEYNAFFPAGPQRPGAGDGGKRCFHGGLAGDSMLLQSVDLWAAAVDVDAEKVGFELGGQFGGLGDRDDNARLTARFLDAGGKALGGTSLGGVTAAARGNVTALLPSSVTGRVPAGTRAVALTLHLNRQASQGPNHAAADNLRLILRSLEPPKGRTLRVLTFHLRAPAPALHAANVIQLADADLVALQEPGASAAALAAQLGYYHVGLRTRESPAILSRFPIARTYLDGVEVQPFPGPGVCLFNVHLAPMPAVPALVKRASVAGDRQAAAAAAAAHGPDVRALLAQAEPHVKAGKVVFLAGDFNEPSHLDWTASTSATGRHGGRIVAWQTSQALLAAGFKDAFRALHVDEVDHPGLTWPIAPAAGADAGDRLDFLYFAGSALQPVSVGLLGPDGKAPDLPYTPFPSDHRGLAATFAVSR